MPLPEIKVFRLPPDFAERCRDVRATQDRGEPCTMQQLSDQLGLPFEFLSAAMAIEVALRSGKPVLIDPSPIPPSH